MKHSCATSNESMYSAIVKQNYKYALMVQIFLQLVLHFVQFYNSIVKVRVLFCQFTK